MLLDSQGGLYRWSILLSETEEVCISCKFEQSFRALGKLLARPVCSSVLPTLSFEAEEPGNQGRTACFNLRVSVRSCSAIQAVRGGISAAPAGFTERMAPSLQESQNAKPVSIKRSRFFLGFITGKPARSPPFENG